MEESKILKFELQTIQAFRGAMFRDSEKAKRDETIPGPVKLIELVGGPYCGSMYPKQILGDGMEVLVIPVGYFTVAVYKRISDSELFQYKATVAESDW